MDTAFFIITNRCTRRCPFCFYSTGYREYPSRELDGRQVITAIERLAEIGVSKLIITGGEPMLRRDLGELLNRSRELGMARLLLSNADLLDERSAGELIARGLDGLSISVHSLADAERVGGAVGFLRRSGRIGITSTIVLSRNNAAELPELLSWAGGLRLRTIIQPAFIPPDSDLFAALSPRFLDSREWEKTAALIKEWGRGEGCGDYADYFLALYGQGPPARPSRCMMGTQVIVVDADGTVFACFHKRDLPGGNILTEPPGEIIEKMRPAGERLSGASCYGEHCVSLFLRSLPE